MYAVEYNDDYPQCTNAPFKYDVSSQVVKRSTNTANILGKKRNETTTKKGRRARNRSIAEAEVEVEAEAEAEAEERDKKRRETRDKQYTKGNDEKQRELITIILHSKYLELYRQCHK